MRLVDFYPARESGLCVIFMRIILLALGFLSVSGAFADSRLLTLEDKVARSDFILRVSITATNVVLGKKEKYEVDTAVCRARVIEILKGTGPLAEVEFRFSFFTGTKLPEISDERYVFLFKSKSETGAEEYRVIEGSDGLYPMFKTYGEYRRDNASSRLYFESLSSNEFVATIRQMSEKKAKDSDKKTGGK